MATYTVSTGADDGYTDGSTLNTTSTALVIGNPTPRYSFFARFQNVTVPQGSTITSASISVKAAQASSTNTYWTIRLNDIDSSTSPTDQAGFSGLALTTNSFGEYLPSSTANTRFDSGDISSVVQEVVDRVGWSSGNAMTIVVYGGGTSFRNLYSYNNAAGDAPTLTITYSTGSTPNSAFFQFM